MVIILRVTLNGVFTLQFFDPIDKAHVVLAVVDAVYLLLLSEHIGNQGLVRAVADRHFLKQLQKLIA